MKSWPYRDRSRLATEASPLGAVLRGQVRELLDIFGWALPFDGCASRPTDASYSSSSSFLTAAICRRSNSVTLTERHRSAARMRGAGRGEKSALACGEFRSAHGCHPTLRTIRRNITSCQSFTESGRSWSKILNVRSSRRDQLVPAKKSTFNPRDTN
jgi:hypothetical protein